VRIINHIFSEEGKIDIIKSTNVSVINNTLVGGGISIYYPHESIFNKIVGNLFLEGNYSCEGISAWGGGTLIANNTFFGCRISVGSCRKCLGNMVINNKFYRVLKDTANLWFQRAGISFSGYNNIIKNNLLIENGYAVETYWNHIPYNIVVNNTIKYSIGAAFLIRYINYSDLTKKELMQAIRPLVENNILIDNRKEFVFAGISRVIPPMDKSNEKEWNWKIFLFPILGVIVTIILFGFFYVHFRKR
jgi:hypothetical protein